MFQNITKDTRSNILIAASKLFMEKGFDRTSVSDIINEVGIAKGTLYHHFDSKEEIMDELIAIKTQSIIVKVREIAEDRSMSIEDRFIKSIAAMSIVNQDENKAMMDHMNSPQNALMHQKINKILLNEIPNILSIIIKDGIAEDVFKTPYPLEAIEIAVVYLETLMSRNLLDLGPSQIVSRIEIFFYNFERILGVEQGKLEYIKNAFIDNLN